VPGSGTANVVVPVVGITGVTVLAGGIPGVVTVLPELPKVPMVVPLETMLQVVVIVFVSNVTAAVSAMTLPHESVAAVFIVTLSSAIIFPMNDVLVPMVAEVPTTQSTSSFEPRFSIETLDPLAVVSVLPIWKTKI
jgi:hypothetical protein